MTAVIIINYKSEEQTITFVREQLSKLKEINVVIVDNGGNEHSSDTLCNALHATLVTEDCFTPNRYGRYVITSAENLGFARGNNLAAKFARKNLTPDYLLFSNTDIKICSTEIIDVLIAKMEEHADVAIIGPEVIGLDGCRQSPEPYISFWDKYVRKTIAYHFYSKQKKEQLYNLDYTNKAQEGYVYKVMGSFFLVRANDFYLCGMMDPATFLYYEEYILTERMKKIGKKVYFDPSVQVIHDHGTTIKKYNSLLKMENYNLESGCYFYRNYMKVPLVQIIAGKIIYKLFFQYVAFKNAIKTI